MSPIVEHFRSTTHPAILNLTEDVWMNRDFFVRWPKRSHLLISGCKRSDGPYHSFDPDLRSLLRSARVKIDSRSNGPAIMAFLYAGGERPKRLNGHGWSTHHIYDGQFPAPARTKSVRAIENGEYFTEAAGLVAIHPLADGMASEVPFFAWLLRQEAFLRFGFDPDGVFTSSQ